MGKITNIIFDADGTLLKGENPYLALAEKLGCRNEVMAWVTDYLNGKLSYNKLLENEIDIFIKKHRLNYGSAPHTGDFERLSTPPEIRKGVDAIIKDITSYGIKPFILSSGFRYIIKELSKVSIAPDRVYANRFLYDGNGHFVTIQVNVDAKKVSALKKMVKEYSLDLTRTAYIGDNEFDRPAIEYILKMGGYVFFLNDSKSIFKIKNKPQNKRFIQIDKLSSIVEYLGQKDPHEAGKEIYKKIKDAKVILMCGLPGTGKSAIARYLEKYHHYVRISSNQIRLKELYPGTQKYGGSYGKDNHFNIRKNVYHLMQERALKYLKSGKKVILDGTYMDELRLSTLSKIKTLVSPNEISIIVVKTDEELIRKWHKNESPEELEKLMMLYEFWKKDTVAGKFWYPRKENYPDIDIIEVVNGKVQK